MTTGSRVGGKYLFLSLRQTRGKRGQKFVVHATGPKKKTLKGQDRNAGEHDRDVGGAPVASYIVQKDQQEGTFFLSPSLKQRAAKQ